MSEITQQLKMEEKLLKAVGYRGHFKGASVADIVRYLLDTEESMKDIPDLASIEMGLKNAVGKNLLWKFNYGIPIYKIKKSKSRWAQLREDLSAIGRRNKISSRLRSTIVIKGKMAVKRIIQVIGESVMEREISIPACDPGKLMLKKH